MDAHEVEAILERCERALGLGQAVDLREVGFWRAVGAVKRHPEWVEQYAERIAAIDRQAFQRAVRPIFPPLAGTVVFTLGTLLGLLLVAASRAVPGRWSGPALLLGTGMLLGTTHDLAHMVLGRLLGIRFVGWFLDGPTRLQPGLKIDYATYLRTPARRRAWMHASGALVTKIVPFAVLGAAIAGKAAGWVKAALLGLGILQIGTDLIFSVRQSDWKRFRRELRVAQHLDAPRT